MRQSKRILDSMPVYQHVVKILWFLLFIFLIILFLLPWQQTSFGTGFVTAYSADDRQQVINSPITGRVEKWFVQEGAYIKEGDPIVQISDNDPGLLERLQLKKQAIESSLKASQQAAETGSLNVERQKSLFELGASSRHRYEEAKVAHMQLLQALANEKVKLNQINISLARQQTQLVTAPRAGTILRRITGDKYILVTAGEVLASFVPDVESSAAEVYISGLDAPLVHVGDSVRLQFEGWPAVQVSGWPAVAIGSFSGKVKSIDSARAHLNRFRILVMPEKVTDWPNHYYLKQGLRVRAWVLLSRVTVGYELWRIFNGFPMFSNNEAFNEGLKNNSMERLQSNEITSK